MAAELYGQDILGNDTSSHLIVVKYFRYGKIFLKEDEEADFYDHVDDADY